jgi:glyoxylase-like metal-dependent hydrolase (beta-lactamase superfamily II)
VYAPRHYDLGHERLEIDGEHDLFGDGSVVLIPSFGHTPGHQSLKVKVDGKDVIITADACYLKASLEKMTLPDAMVVNDAQGMLDNFNLFKQLKSKGAMVLYGHDPEQSKLLTDGAIRRVRPAALAGLQQ